MFKLILLAQPMASTRVKVRLTTIQFAPVANIGVEAWLKLNQVVSTE